MSNGENLGFLDNPLVKNVALGIVKKAFKSHNLTLITIEMKPDGELNFEAFTEQMKVMTETQFNHIVKTLQE